MNSVSTEEHELLNDSKYRGYMNQIDRCLRGFESTSEWADLIAALSKLNKVLLAHMKYPIIPRRVLISKRLAQCMHPALPAGVHQKALETYDIIFKCMGTNRLATELFIYSAGLFPLLCNAALNVRSILLSIYETHFVPLGQRLRPALNGFLSGVLPGLEEGSEHYQKTNTLLESVAEAVHPQIFYSALWECVATNSTVRLPALTFVLAHCGKKNRSGNITMQPHQLGTDHDVMCRALCLALQDTSVLVQRSALDLLLQGFPLHQPQFITEDMVSLMASVLKSLLRRDMSLNRRLFSWLHGTESSTPGLLNHSFSTEEGEGVQDSYFCSYAKDLVVLAVRKIIEDTINSRYDDEEKTFNAKPYRILSALIDKPEVGPYIIEDVILDIFRLLFFMSGKGEQDLDLNGQGSTSGHGQDNRKSAVPQELIKTANLLFSQLETGYVWSVCCAKFSIACQLESEDTTSRGADGRSILERSLSDFSGVSVHSIGSETTDIKEMCTLIDLLLDIVSIETYAEISVKHLPKLFQSMVASISRDIMQLDGCRLATGLRSVKRVLERIMSAVSVWEENKAGGGGMKEDQLLYSSGDETQEAIALISEDGYIENDSPPKSYYGLITGCVPAYTTMFLKLLQARILDTKIHTWRSILFTSTGNPGHQELGEQDSLAAILNRFMQGKDLSNTNKSCIGHEVGRATLKDLDDDIIEAFQVACSGLLELSSMPRFGSESDVKEDSGTCDLPDDLPDWLQGILLSATIHISHTSKQIPRAQMNNLEIQLSAISSLLDLGSLAATCQPSQGSLAAQHTVSVTVPLDPLLKEHHLRTMINETEVVYQIAQSLWTYLETAPPQHHPQCIHLLHRLLELSPDAAGVENVLAGSLAAPSNLVDDASSDSAVSVFKRFAQFWHLSRDLSTRQRTMDLCLMKMVSGLCSGSSSVRVVCEVWVEHALTRGDTGRLLETLLLALLEPSTSRLSILHWNPSLNNNMVSTPRVKSRKNERYPEDEASSAGFPFSLLSEGLVNPFALVNSESEFNADPCSDSASQHHSRLMTPVTRSESGSSLYQSNLILEDSSPGNRTHSNRSSSRGYSSLKTVCSVDNGEADLVVADILDAIMERVVGQDAFLLRLDELSFPFARDSSSDGMEREEGDDDDISSHLEHDEAHITDLKDKHNHPEKGVEDKDDCVHPLHSHILLYNNPIDSRSLLHFLTALMKILKIQPQLGVSSLSSTGVASPSLSRGVQLIQLLARHKRSILGKGFSAQSVSGESVAGYRSAMLLEVILTINLYFIRSFYPQLPGLSREEILGNRELQLTASQLINQIVTELILLVNESGKPFALFLVDIFRRIKLQKVILHTVLSLVHNVPTQSLVTSQILRLNMGETELNAGGVNSDAFQVEMLKLVVSLVMLEEVVFQKKHEDSERNHQPPVVSTIMKYHPEFPFAEQPMLLASVLSALRQPHLRDIHSHWANLVISCLPFFGSSLTRVVTSVCGQIWGNLENIAQQAINAKCQDNLNLSKASTQHDKDNDKSQESLPASSDYVLMQLESLGHILSYCLLDTGQAGGLLSSSSQSSLPSIHSAVASFVHSLDNKTRKPTANKAYMLAARQSLLSMTPRLVVALTTLWNAASDSSTVWLVGSGKAVKGMILELLSPLAKVHPAHFLSALSIARWELNEGGGSDGTRLIHLVSSLKIFPMTTVISTLRQVLKSPPTISGSLGNRLEVYAMEFLSAYLASLNQNILADAWGSLKDLLKDCLILKPASVFLALEILHQSVTRDILTNMDKKEIREIQEIAGKLIETVSGLGGCMLEAATWLRGTRTVKTQIVDKNEMSSSHHVQTSGQLAQVSGTSGHQIQVSGTPGHQVQTAATALNLLGRLMVNILDIIYTSEEKEKVLPLLTTVMYNTVPYLRNHTKSGMCLLQGASKVLASVSEYPYTRRCWKKDGLDLLLDPAFFNMDYESLKSWRITTDNLMTHDKITFKDLLTRIAGLGQSNMSLFSSKELEQEQRALLLKRLAFVIFCSDVDQHQKHMPDITDRLSECLRSVPVSPSVLAAVFLCFRVILIRMSAMHVAFLWPVIITEMVIIFSTMENLIYTQIKQKKKLSSGELTSIINTGSNVGYGLEANDSASWMNVYLAVCKLLDQVVLLPSSQLPQFQMYKWAFIREGCSPETNHDIDASTTVTTNGVSHNTAIPPHGGSNKGGSKKGGKNAGVPGVLSKTVPLQSPDFVPHVARIHKLIETRVGREIVPCRIPVGEPILTMKSIQSLNDLGPWFSALSNSLTRQQTKSMQNISAISRSPLSFLEKIIEQDFLEFRD